MSRYITLIPALGMAFFLLSCSDDDPVLPQADLTTYKSLTSKDDVLHNVERAYTERNLVEFERLLDNDFVFHFSPTDFEEGEVGVERWFITEEYNSARNMFDPTFNPPDPRYEPISSIDLSLAWEEGDDNWTAIPDADPINHPGEAWYKMTVGYVLTVLAGTTTFTSGGTIDASFVVRLEEDTELTGEDHPIWQIVAWWDDIAEAEVAEPLAARRITETRTWGAVKAFFYAPR